MYLIFVRLYLNMYRIALNNLCKIWSEVSIPIPIMNMFYEKGRMRTKMEQHHGSFGSYNGYVGIFGSDK